ncbi:MAG: anti-sigma factor, partial [Pyrinomonadaceae bacterium]
MKCADIQFELTLYADGLLDDMETNAVEEHLATCPLCREARGEYLEISTTLRKIRRPEISLSLKNKISETVRSEATSNATPAIRPDLLDWFQMRVMPFGVGVLASVLVAVSFLGMMFNGMLQPPPVETAKTGQTTVMLAANNDPYMGLDPLDIV